MSAVAPDHQQSQPTAVPQSQRLDSLTSLRFLAALMVLALHGSQFFVQGSAVQKIANVGFWAAARISDSGFD